MNSSSINSSIIPTICHHAVSKKDMHITTEGNHRAVNRPDGKTALAAKKQTKKAPYCPPLAFVPTKVERANVANMRIMEWTTLTIMEFGAATLVVEGTPILTTLTCQVHRCKHRPRRREASAAVEKGKNDDNTLPTARRKTRRITAVAPRPAAGFPTIIPNPKSPSPNRARIANDAPKRAEPLPPIPRTTKRSADPIRNR